MSDGYLIIRVYIHVYRKAKYICVQYEEYVCSQKNKIMVKYYYSSLMIGRYTVLQIYNYVTEDNRKMFVIKYILRQQCSKKEMIQNCFLLRTWFDGSFCGEHLYQQETVNTSKIAGCYCKENWAQHAQLLV